MRGTKSTSTYILWLCDFCLQSQRLFSLVLLFTVHVDVSRVTNTRLKLSVAAAGVCRRAAFSPRPTIRPTWLRSVYSIFPSLCRKYRWFFLQLQNSRTIVAFLVSACVLTKDSGKYNRIRKWNSYYQNSVMFVDINSSQTARIRNVGLCLKNGVC